MSFSYIRKNVVLHYVVLKLTHNTPSPLKKNKIDYNFVLNT